MQVARKQETPRWHEITRYAEFIHENTNLGWERSCVIAERHAAAGLDLTPPREA